MTARPLGVPTLVTRIRRALLDDSDPSQPMRPDPKRGMDHEPHR